MTKADVSELAAMAMSWKAQRKVTQDKIDSLTENISPAGADEAYALAMVAGTLKACISDVERLIAQVNEEAKSVQ